MRTLAQKGLPMVGAPPKCSEHNLAIELVRVDVSDEAVTDVFRCPYPECKTEYSIVSRRAVKTSLESSR